MAESDEARLPLAFPFQLLQEGVHHLPLQYLEAGAPPPPLALPLFRPEDIPAPRALPLIMQEEGAYQERILCTTVFSYFKETVSSIEGGFIQKKRQMSSLLFEGQNLFNSMPRYSCLAPG